MIYQHTKIDRLIIHVKLVITHINYFIMQLILYCWGEGAKTAVPTRRKQNQDQYCSRMLP
jgi:hypothetical protein